MSQEDSKSNMVMITSDNKVAEGLAEQITELVLQHFSLGIGVVALLRLLVVGIDLIRKENGLPLMAKNDSAKIYAAVSQAMGEAGEIMPMGGTDS